MLSEIEAIRKAKENYPAYNLERGTRCRRTYAFIANKNGEPVYGCLCIDAKTGEPCGSPSIMAINRAFKRHPFKVK